MDSFGRALRLARLERGLTLEGLAGQLGVSAPFVSKLECGRVRPSERILSSCSSLLGVNEAAIGAGLQDGVREPQTQLDFFESPTAVEDKLLPRERLLSGGAIPSVEWDIPQTISELAYLTHNYFRYYGKFPATIPRKLLVDYSPPVGTWVLDPFVGSGTTLVEAKLRGVPSFGLDSSPLAVFASKVKVSTPSQPEIRSQIREVVRTAERERHPLPVGKDLAKWFSSETVEKLAGLKSALLRLPLGAEREFLVLAFLAIIRRVSRAYDGEVRPHVNPEKPVRDPVEAFGKKVNEMLVRLADFAGLVDPTVPAMAVRGDARKFPKGGMPASARVGLIIAHPPYLNCFDYAPVYRLEYLWAEGFEELGAWDYDSVRKAEMRAWPATDEKVEFEYFEALRATFLGIKGVCDDRVRCCVVLGDCTIKGRVVPVLDRLVALMEEIGFDAEKMIYRTTHYGIGKYAYSTRADYHGAGAEKRDGVAVFRLRQ